MKPRGTEMNRNATFDLDLDLDLVDRYLTMVMAAVISRAVRANLSMVCSEMVFSLLPKTLLVR